MPDVIQTLIGFCVRTGQLFYIQTESKLKKNVLSVQNGDLVYFLEVKKFIWDPSHDKLNTDSLSVFTYQASVSRG